MYRKNLTWFGFNITQKQAVQIFILSLIGIIFSLFMLLSFISSFLMSFSYYDPSYYPDNYLSQMFISMLPFIILALIILSLSWYSTVRCRQISKSYSQQIFNEPKSINVPQYCANCGLIRTMGHQFCKNCGERF